MSEPKLTYGLSLQTNRLIHVSSVPNGKECGLFCPACKKVLSAIGNKEGKEYKRKAHFRHDSGADCAGARMSALHRLAQELIQDQKQVLLPEYKGKYYHQDAGIITFDEVRLEESVQIKDGGLRRVDVLGIKDEVEYWIEIKVTHAVDEEKKNDIKANNSNCIEIDLSDLLNTWFSEQSVTERLLKNNCFHKWVNSPNLDAKELAAKKEFDKKEREFIQHQKAILCQKLTEQFLEHKTLLAYIQNPILCNKHETCPLAGTDEECGGFEGRHENLCVWFDTITHTQEYEGEPVNLILTHSEHPERILLIQIICEEERKINTPKSKHRLIRVVLHKKAIVEHINLRNGLNLNSDNLYHLNFYNFKLYKRNSIVRKDIMCESKTSHKFDKLIIYDSGKFYLSQCSCKAVFNTKSSSLNEYVIKHDLVYSYGLRFIAATIAKQNGYQLSHCNICLNNMSRQREFVDCRAQYYIGKNRADQCHFYSENTKVMNEISVYLSQDSIKIK